MECYLDNAATTKVHGDVADKMMEVMLEDFGNPSSKHTKGMEAENHIRNAERIISESLKCSSKEIIFTSGGTESDNHAIIGTAMANQRAGRHIITTVVEHPAVLEPMAYLEKLGFEVTYMPVDGSGRVDPDSFKDVVRDDTILVSVMHVNNEIGSVNDLLAISKAIKSINPKVIFHTDAIQSFGKYRIYPEKLGVDMLSVSGHKINGPKGVGFLYVRDKVKINPIIFGGGQQKGRRSGTENVPGIAGLGLSVSDIYDDFDKKIEKMYELKKRLTDGILDIPGTKVNGVDNSDLRGSAPHIVSASFENVKSEVLLHALEQKKIFISSGSACSSNHPEISGTLKAIGVKENLLDSTVRFSLSSDTETDDIEYCLKELDSCVHVLRQYIRH